jgi:hypothetical protein
MLNSMLKIFVGPVMGGLNPHQPLREYATEHTQKRCSALATLCSTGSYTRCQRFAPIQWCSTIATLSVVL